ncbi:MAG: dihydroorotate dehydrogenase [Spirochaetales bacterium]|nr:MAG: dihydroorotate dehydrogenase [Spirochaetales bacterium]
MVKTHQSTDLTVTIGNKVLPNPVWIAAGIYGYETEYELAMATDKVAAICTRAITRLPKAGHAAPRIVEVGVGLLNSTGLAGTGMEAFAADKTGVYSSVGPAVIVNVAGETPQEYAEIVRYLEQSDCADSLWGYELNISYPTAGMDALRFGTDAVEVTRITRSVRESTVRPLIVKLTPNVTDIVVLARAAEDAGADAISAINTLLGMAINVTTRTSVLPSVTGGLSGPPLLPVGVAAVYRVCRDVRIPVIGVGGIGSVDDALQYLLAGASSVQVGSALLGRPALAEEVLIGIQNYAESNGIHRIRDFHHFIK